jgi:hypothetical protein
VVESGGGGVKEALFDPVDDPDFEDVKPGQLKAMLEGRKIIKVDISGDDDDETSRVLLWLDEGSAVRLDAVAQHGMDAVVQPCVPKTSK